MLQVAPGKWPKLCELVLGLPSGKRSQNELERSTILLMGKSTISTGQFSIANCLFTRPGMLAKVHHECVLRLSNPLRSFDTKKYGLYSPLSWMNQ